MRGTYIVVHESTALEKHCIVVGESRLVEVGAVVLDGASVVNAPVVVIDVVDAPDPVPGRLSVLRVGLVVGVSCQSRAHVEEDTVRNG
jgi:hypothetical protein